LHGGNNRTDTFNIIINDRDDGYDKIIAKSIGVVKVTSSTAKVAYRLIKSSSSGVIEKEISRYVIPMELTNGNWKIKGDGKKVPVFVIDYKRLSFDYPKASTTIPKYLAQKSTLKLPKVAPITVVA
jgi:hypothetical protein